MIYLINLFVGIGVLVGCLELNLGNVCATSTRHVSFAPLPEPLEIAPLITAAEEGNLVAIQKLYEEGAILMQTQIQALCVASAHGRIEAVSALLDRGVSPNSHCLGNPLKENPVKGTALKGMNAVESAVVGGQIEVLEFLIAQGGLVNDPRSNESSNPLILASQLGNLAIMKILINNGANIDAKDAYGRNPVKMALQQGKLDALALLLARSPFPKKQAVEAVIESIKSQQIEILKFLINNGAEELVLAERYSDLILIAARFGADRVLEFLLDRGDSISVMTARGTTPLMMAAHYGHVRFVDRLIQLGADINATNKNGDTALSLAVKQGKVAIARLLIQHGANRVDAHGNSIEKLAIFPQMRAVFAES